MKFIIGFIIGIVFTFFMIHMKVSYDAGKLPFRKRKK